MCCLIVSVCVHAQEKDSTYVYPRKFLLDEMVVSANRWEQNIREVSNRISKINSSLIQFQNPQTAADLVGASNQVFIQKSQLGGGSPMIRGFATNRVLLVVDGVRMNNAIFRSGNVQNVISLDANAIDDAEVIFGPGSVIYGSDAIGGVMDFHTLTPTLSKTGKAEFSFSGLTRYSSANQEYTNHLDLNIGLKKFALVTSFTHSEYDDLRMGSRGPTAYLRSEYQTRLNGIDTVLRNSDPTVQIHSGYSQDNFLQKILFQPNENVSFHYSFHYSGTSDVPRYDRLILKNEDGTFPSSQWYYGPQQWVMHTVQASANKATSVWDHVRVTLAYQNYQESRHNRNFGSNTRTNRFEEVASFSANVDADKQFNKTTLFYGVEFVNNQVGSTAYRENIVTGTKTPATTRYPDGSRWQSTAAYLSVKHKLSDQVLLNGSARVSHVKTEATFDLDLFPFPFTDAHVNNTAVNGSMGVVYTPTSDWKVYVNLATGFRAPNVDDIGKVFDSQPGDVVVPNPDLKPEYAYNAEAGFVVREGNFTIDFAGYYSVVDQAIARAATTFNGEDSIDYDGTLSRVLSQQNISSVRVGGFQIGLDWYITKEWQVTSHINWQHGKETYPDSIRTYSPTHVAPWFGSTHIIFSKGNMKTDLFANYNGSIDFQHLALSERADRHLYAIDGNGNPYAPSWYTLNFKASIIASNHLTVDVGVENIFDARYRPYSSGISAAGRNVLVALRIHL